MKLKITTLVLFLLYGTFTHTKIPYNKNTKRLNILICVGHFPKVHDICIQNHITGLIDCGHEVSIFSRGRGTDIAIQDEILTYNLMEKIYYKEFPVKNINNFDIIIFEVGHHAFNVKKTF